MTYSGIHQLTSRSAMSQETSRAEYVGGRNTVDSVCRWPTCLGLSSHKIPQQQSDHRALLRYVLANVLSEICTPYQSIKRATLTYLKYQNRSPPTYLCFAEPCTTNAFSGDIRCRLPFGGGGVCRSLRRAPWSPDFIRCTPIHPVRTCA